MEGWEVPVREDSGGDPFEGRRREGVETQIRFLPIYWTHRGCWWVVLVSRRKRPNKGDRGPILVSELK